MFLRTLSAQLATSSLYGRDSPTLCLVLVACRTNRILALYFAHSTRTISAEGCAGTGQIALSPAFRALDTHDLRRGLRGQPDKSHSRVHFARSKRTISAEGCARTAPIALSPAFRALDTHDLCRGLRGHGIDRPLACISSTRHARSPQRVARACRQIALSPAFRALDAHDLRRGLRADRTNRTLACISHTRHARSPQRVARTLDKSHSRLHFAHSTRTISADRGLHFRLTLFVPPSAFKREFIKWGDVLYTRCPLGHLPCKLSILTLAYSLHTH